MPRVGTRHFIVISELSKHWPLVVCYSNSKYTKLLSTIIVFHDLQANYYIKAMYDNSLQYSLCAHAIYVPQMYRISWSSWQHTRALTHAHTHTHTLTISAYFVVCSRMPRVYIRKTDKGQVPREVMDREPSRQWKKGCQCERQRKRTTLHVLPWTTI